MTDQPTEATRESVVMALYIGTKALHVEAERSGVISDLLLGEASRDGYTLLQRNLLPAYQALERGLERHRNTPSLMAFTKYRLERSAALEADLVELCGGDFGGIPLLPEGEAYAQRVDACAEGDGARLIAHAYTRYLGDLNGGQILKRLLMKKPGLRAAEVSFYDFPDYDDLPTLKADYRDALDQAGTLVADPQAVIDEGMVAFQLNIDLSWAVQNALLPEAAK
jgi:heme oxygenase